MVITEDMWTFSFPEKEGIYLVRERYLETKWVNLGPLQIFFDLEIPWGTDGRVLMPLSGVENYSYQFLILEVNKREENEGTQLAQ